MFNILVTGATGTLGKNLVDAISDRYPSAMLWGVSRDEQKLIKLSQEYPIATKICDIGIEDAISCISSALPKKIDVIYHTAALKCVDFIESNIEAAMRTNFQGTRNILRLAEIKGSKVVMASTDKAVYPINAYGMSKALAEKIVLKASAKHAVVRYGNVLGSRGSVLPIWIDSLIKSKTVRITDDRMTRFWIPVEDAVNFVMHTGIAESSDMNSVSVSKSSGINIPPLVSCHITDLAKAIAKILGINYFTFENIGIRPGEKLHECLEAGEYEDVCSDTHFIANRNTIIEMIGSTVRRIASEKGYHWDSVSK